MGKWVGEVVLKNDPGGNPNAWIVDAPISYCCDPAAPYTKGLACVLTVKRGAKTDGASIPRVAWRIMGPPLGDTYTAAAVLHDTLYRTNGGNYQLTRAECDGVFFQAMLDSGVSWWRAFAMWSAVRAMGSGAWIRADYDTIRQSEDYLKVVGK